MYDVVIIGAGYAGSSLAAKLDGLDIIVLDRNEGSKNVSAVTFSDIVEDRAIRATYSKFTLFNTRGDAVEYSFDDELFCLVDYPRLCREAYKEVERVEVRGYRGDTIYTQDGEIKARVIVDCSGIDGEQLRVSNGFNLPPVINALSFQDVKEVNVSKDTFYLIMGFANFGGWIYPHAYGAEFGMANRFRRGKSLEFPDLAKARNIEAIRKFIGGKGGEVIRVKYPYGFVKKVVYGNVVLLGDSAGMTHPVYGMSIHYISEVSSKLAVIIRDYVKGHRRLQDFQEFWKKFLGRIRVLTARGYAIWDMPLEIQENLVTLQRKMEVSPKSIVEDIRGFEDYEVYAKNPPKITDYPLKLLLKTLLYWLKLRV